MNLLNQNKLLEANYLVLEDSRTDQLIINDLMSQIGIRTEQIYFSAAISSIPDKSYDYILSDLNVVDSEKLDTIIKLRTRYPEAIIIVLSGLNDIGLATEAIQAGAQDYLIKGETHALELQKTLLFAYERHRLAQQIISNEAKFRGLIDSNYDGILIQDQQMFITYVSPSVKNILGYCSGEMLGKKITDFVFTDDITAHLELEMQLLNSQITSATNKERIINKSGEAIWIEVTLTGHLNTPGINGIVLNFKNIDQETKALEQQKRSDERLKEIIKAMPGAVLSYQLFPDGSDKLLYLSEGAEKIWGISRDKALQNLNEVWQNNVQQDFSEMRKSIEFSARNLSVWNERFALYRNGQHHWINAIGTPSPQSDGSIIWNTLAFDITELVKTEEALKNSNERFELAGKATKDIIWDFDLTTKNLYCSEGFKNIFGCTYNKEKESIENFLERIHPLDREKVNKGVKEKIYQCKENLWEDEFRLIKHDGSISYVSGQGYIIYDQYKNPVRMVGALQDHTEKRKLLYDIQERNKELTCLFSVSQIINDSKLSTKEIFEKTIELLIAAYQYPEITCARIRVKDIDLCSQNFQKTKWTDQAIIKLSNQDYGLVEVCYLEPRQASEYGPFLKEESDLINAVAKLLGNMLDKKQSAQRLINLNRQLEKSLKEVSDYKLALDQSAIVAITDKKLRTIQINQNLCNVSHYEKHELIGKNIFSELTVKAKKAEPSIKQIIRKGEIWQGEISYINKKQEVYWLQTTIVPFAESNTSPERYMLISKDITIRKNAEAQLKKSEANLQAIFDNTSDGYLLVNKEGEIISCNQAVYEICRNVFSTSLENNILKAFPAIYQDDFKENLKKVFDDSHIQFERNIQIKEASFWFIISMVPVKTGLDLVEAACIGIKNITDLKYAEQEIKRVAANLEALLNNTEDAYVLLDRDLKIKSYNVQAEKFAKLIGRATTIGTGISYLHLVPHPEEAMFKAIQKAFQGSKVDYMHNVQLKSGEIAMHVIVNPIITSAGEIKEVSVVTRDITKRKIYEKELIFQQQLLINSQQLASLGSLEWDLNTNKLNATKEFFEIFNTNPALNDIDQIFYNSIHEEDRHLVEAVYAEAIQEKKSFEIEFRTCPKVTIERIIKGKGIINIGRKGKVSRIFCTFQDITEQKSADRALQLGQEIERNRLAKDLHDDIGQLLTATKFRLEAFDLSNPENNYQQLDAIKELLNVTIKEVRSLTRNLSTQVLEHYGLEKAIGELCKPIHEFENIVVNFHYQSSSQLDTKLQVNIYRIIQEAINNILKHAEASEIEINVIEQNKTLNLQIFDNGKGFEVDSVSINESHGLHNMKERTSLFLGQFEIRSKKQKGTKISCKFPIIK